MIYNLCQAQMGKESTGLVGKRNRMSLSFEENGKSGSEQKKLITEPLFITYIIH